MRIVDALPPVAPTLALLIAAVMGTLAKLERWRRALQLLAIVTAASVTAMCVVLLVHTGDGVEVHWFGGWTPRSGVAGAPSRIHAIGIDFAVDPLGAGMATLAGVLVTAALVFSWRYFEQEAAFFEALMLGFLAAMVAFSFTGDIFDLFVFFELMGVCAYALTAYRVEDRGPIQGALNFAVTNSVGAYLMLAGIGLVYARTGALNMAEIGEALAGRPLDGLVVVSFLIIAVGLMVKASIVPFQFWLADAHAVAPTPVCVLFSGVMVELGLYGVVRVWWSCFAPAFGAHATVVKGVWLGLGISTTLVGALFCIVQHHIKRLLAYSTMAHAGMFLCGIALFTPLGLGAVGVYVLGHGLVKGSLFLGSGLLLHRFRSVSERALFGRGRVLPLAGVLWSIAALALAGLPPFATYAGKGLMEDASIHAGLPWLPAVLVVASALTGGAVLRVGLRVFLGLGHQPPDDATSRHAGFEEETGEEQHTPVTMWVPVAALLAACCAAGLLPALFDGAQTAAARLLDPLAYGHAILAGTPSPVPAVHLESTAPTLFDAGTGAAAAVGAVIVGVVPCAVRVEGRARSAPARWLRRLRHLQSGDVRDYLTWLVLGAGIVGAVLALGAMR